MNGRLTKCRFTLVLLLCSVAVPLYAQKPPQREVAITIDDLPAAGGNAMTGKRNH